MSGLDGLTFRDANGAIVAMEAANWLTVNGVRFERDTGLRAAVAALMATGNEDAPWWGEPTMLAFMCVFCGRKAGRAQDVTHAPDCPAMAVQAAMKGDDDGDS